MRQYRTAVAVAATRPSHWRAEARRTAFLFQDGVLLAAACFAFDALELLDGKPYGAGGLPGTGYLGAAWHCLEATGWIETDPAPAWTERGLEALRHRARLVAGGAFLARFDDNTPGCWDTPWDVATQAAFAALLRDHERWRAGADPADPLTTYLDAALAVPSILTLRGTGRLHRPTGDFARLFRLLGWLGPDGGWTQPGQACLAGAGPVALDRAGEVLGAAGVPAPLLLIGDVTDPGSVRTRLAEHGLAIDDGLHIRSFLDHDRTYLGGEARDDVPGWSTGVYLAPDGSPLSAREVESDLVAHLRRWPPHVGRVRLGVIEAHNVDP